MAKILTQIEAHNIRNIRLYAGDAAELLAWAPPRSMARIDLIHPDPWPKRRHWKRRFVQDATVAAMARLIRPGGEFRFVSDIDDVLRMDAGASAALTGFSLDRGARDRLAPALGRLHHDALRPQSRTRRPRGGVLAISKKQLGVFTWLPFCPQGLELGNKLQAVPFFFRQRTKPGTETTG